MSMAIRAKNAKQRAAIAITKIKKNQNFYRTFDDCFEMNDGDEVMKFIIAKARTDRELAVAITQKMPGLGSGDYNKRLNEAIAHCLSEQPILF